jgi:hypothetical protein
MHYSFIVKFIRCIWASKRIVPYNAYFGQKEALF